MNLAPGQALAPGLSIALGGVLVPLAIVSFIIAYGLRKARRWAWTAARLVNYQHSVVRNYYCYYPQ
jgi:hypothetical protein